MSLTVPFIPWYKSRKTSAWVFVEAADKNINTLNYNFVQKYEVGDYVQIIVEQPIVLTNYPLLKGTIQFPDEYAFVKFTKLK